MSVAQETRPAPANPDIAASRLISRSYDADEQREHIVASIPSRRDPATRYIVKGHTHGRDAECSCLGFTRHKRCCHAAAFILIIEELERLHYSDPRYTTERLIELARWYESVSPVLDPDQRLRFAGVCAALHSRGVDFRACRTLAERRAIQERAAGAKAILFGE
jgi:hypothetical protein